MIIYADTIRGLTPDRLEGFFVNWKKTPSPEKHLRLLKKSDYILLAIDDRSNRVVGFITAISDTILSAYIPFLEVLPEYQHRGIGSKLVRLMLNRLKEHYMLDLTCDPGMQGFYRKFGLIPSTGMMRRSYDHQSGK